MDTKFNIAVLIDGDNAQPKLLKEILEEVSKYGKATIRRIYGDWTQVQMNGWKELVNKYSINPVQKFSYTVGKNSTDGALIIDAMDILHSRNIEGFCIVSSDSDYTGLAKRIREEGLFAMGIGEKKTPSAFIQSCEVFIYCENLTNNDEHDESRKIKLKKMESVEDSDDDEKEESIVRDSSFLPIIDRAFDISTKEDDEAYISQIGLNLRKIDPSFDPRTYGFRNLTDLFSSINKYEIVKNEVNGLNHPLVKLRTSK